MAQENNYVIIEQQLPSLNDYVKANRASPYKGAKFKQAVESEITKWITIAGFEGHMHPVEEPVDIYIEFHEATTKRDVDNIQFAQKFILDALQQNGILPNDNREYVRQIYHTVLPSEADGVGVFLTTKELKVNFREEEQK